MNSNSPIRIAHVSSAHRWSDNRVHLREAASLASAGYDVTLVAIDHDIEVPNSGVHVVKLKARTRLNRVTFGSVGALYQAFRSRAQIFHLHDPELIWAVPLIRILGRKVIYDAHEDLPSQLLNKHYLPRWARPLASLAGHAAIWLAARSHHVVAATETIAATFPNAKTTVVHNYPRLRAEDCNSLPLSERDPALVYVGSMSIERGMTEMVASFSEPKFPKGWTVKIAGAPAPPSLLNDLRDMPGWSRVDYRGIVSPGEARDLLSTSRVGLVLLRRNKAYFDSLPTKMFECFAAGIPVIASDFPLWRSIVEGNDCGLLVDESDPQAIAAAIRIYADDPELMAQHGENARAAAQSHLNWASEERTLLGVYAAL